MYVSALRRLDQVDAKLDNVQMSQPPPPYSNWTGKTNEPDETGKKMNEITH